MKSAQSKEEASLLEMVSLPGKMNPVAFINQLYPDTRFSIEEHPSETDGAYVARVNIEDIDFEVC